MQFFFFQQSLAGNFFQNHPPPPSRVNGRPLRHVKLQTSPAWRRQPETWHFLRDVTAHAQHVVTSLHGRRPKGKERGKTSGWSARRSDVGGSFLLPPSLLFPALVLTFYGLPRRLSSDLTLPWSWEREDVAFYVATKTKTWVILCIACLRDLQSETCLPCSKEKRSYNWPYIRIYLWICSKGFDERRGFIFSPENSTIASGEVNTILFITVWVFQ